MGGLGRKEGNSGISLRVFEPEDYRIVGEGEVLLQVLPEMTTERGPFY